MAHFAELNNSNIVLQVIVISNEDVNANGGDQSAQAENFVASIVPHQNGGNEWKQTSYNNNFRKQYAGIGHTYNAGKDKFILPQPYPSWSLDSNDDWQAPVTFPTVTEIDSEYVITSWDEANQKWLGEANLKDYEWNASDLSWTEV